MNGALLRLRTS
uniref:Uncharacterized protein n=1 Tax=Anguilla anguilla TaxID=7936 RepID=A0A0E9QMX6_ANGAN